MTLLLNPETRRSEITQPSNVPESSGVELSVVVPAFNEALGIAAFLELLFGVLHGCCGRFEVCVVDDGSRDDTWQRVADVQARFPELSAIRFTRNFGKEAAILAGLRHAVGRAVLVIDADGQHPPALIPQFLDTWRNGGAQIVAARKAARSSDSWMARASARAFNMIMRMVTGLDLTGASDYRLLDRRVVDALLAFPEKVRFFRGMTVWTGFSTRHLSFDVAPRIAGTTQWSSAQLTKLAISAITAYSAKPLGMIFRLGMIGMAAAFLLLMQALYSWLANIAVSGWTSMTVIVLFFGSANLLGIGVLGAYLAQVFDEIKARPEYLIDKELRSRVSRAQSSSDG
ncbi:MAG: glycosyltransferase family 2 protein [Betaproteobacteria bacterium]|nr:glycosyltransferase family 2 protein [Betaproteobacteria bacterium]